MFLKELDMKIQPNIEFKIGIKVVVCQILITLLVQSLYPLCRIIFRGVNKLFCQEPYHPFHSVCLLGKYSFNFYIPDGILLLLY